MDSDRKTICDQCRKPVAISDIRYIQRKESVKALCPECRDWRSSSAKNAPAKTESMSIATPQPVLPAKAVPRPEVQKKVFFCNLCRHKFNLNPSGKSRLVCPYCGRTNGVEEFEIQSADDLIRKIGVE